MREGGAESADISPISLSLIGFKPRQVILAERQLQRNSKVPILMGKSQPENVAQINPEQESLLAYSVALWLEKKGFSKVLNRFLSAAQIEDDDWRAKALNLNVVFSKYLETCNDVHSDGSRQKKPESIFVGSAHVNGETNGRADEEVGIKKTKKNNGEDVWTESGKMPHEMIMNEKAKKSNISGKQEKSDKASDVLGNLELKPKAVNEHKSEKVNELPVDHSNKLRKDKKKKDIDAVPENAEEKNKGFLSKNIDNKNDSDNAVESKDKKKKRKLKDNKLDLTKDYKSVSKHKEVADDDVEKKMTKVEATMSAELPDLKSKSMKRPNDAAEGVSDESKKVSKKRKRMAANEAENQSNVEVAVQELKPKKSKRVKDGKDVQAQIKLSADGGDTHTQNEEETSAKNIDERSKDDVKNELDKFSHSNSGRKKNGSSSEPKIVNAFQRVKIDEVKFADERLQDNSYWAKDGAEIGYGAKAQEVLGQVRGRDFRHEKTKKKRGSYRGGIIDLQSHSIKFNNSDDE